MYRFLKGTSRLNTPYGSTFLRLADLSRDRERVRRLGKPCGSQTVSWLMSPGHGRNDESICRLLKEFAWRKLMVIGQ